MNPGDVLLLISAAAVLVLLIRVQSLSATDYERQHMLEKSERQLTYERQQVDIARTYSTILADTVFDPVFVLDSALRIVTANRVAYETFNIKGDAMGQSLIAVTQNHELDALSEKLLHGETVLDSQIEVKERTFRVRSARVPGPSTASAILVLQDISELLRLTRARREMVANFSHDLRTPISSIRLLVDTLIQNFGRNSERDQRLLGKIAGETDSLQHMTQELIDLSMIESGKAIIRMVPVRLAQILNEAYGLMTTQIEQKKLELVNEVTEDVSVLVDPEQTRRVLTNIIHNSVKFTPAPGRIVLSSARDGQMVTLRVRDSGPGIPPQDRARIFERFYQVDTSRSNQQGSGLGLSIAKHIIEAQGGSIWAEAGIPSGACICFTIPLADENKVPA
ncbi:MAG TPA: HAMP domain-containing sensor histidine kinase [Aggregatilineales bacterium]|nr:HAMP domain-containing sensor histidine kinase [Aggregatilineales bacterium]